MSTVKPIIIKDLTKKYGDFTAIRELSFAVEAGEVFGFLGPNGAGKTTTIRILTGLSRPTSGICKILGQTIRDKIYQHIGVVFEESNLYQRLSGKENLDFFARMYRVKEERVDLLLERYGLAEAASRPVKNYSKGMKRRLLICRALLHEPDLLILDEPTSGLDPRSAEVIREAIKDFKRAGKTVFLTTHYLEEADELCDRVAFISRGKIAAIDKPGVLKRKYGQPFLEIRIESPGEKEEMKLKGILSAEDRIYRDSNTLTIRLSLDTQDAGRKLDKIRENFNVLDIHSQEASLKEVFKQLTGD